MLHVLSRFNGILQLDPFVMSFGVKSVLLVVPQVEVDKSENG
jgi:hypothetical protein